MAVASLNGFALLAYMTSTQSKTKAECEFTLRFRAFTAIASLAMLFSLKSLGKSW